MDAVSDGRIDFQDAIETALKDGQGSAEHIELDPWMWHPSALKCLPECPRQAIIRKLQLEERDPGTAGVFQVGSLLHVWIEDQVQPELPERLNFEQPVRRDDESGVTITGRSDCVDLENGILYDFKSTAKAGYDGDDTRYPSGFLGDKAYHRDNTDQLQVYMACTGADRAQLVYVHKIDMAVKTYPADGHFVHFDEDRFREIVGTAATISDELEARYAVDRAVDRLAVLNALQDERNVSWSHCDQDNCWSCRKYENLLDPSDLEGGAGE